MNIVSFNSKNEVNLVIGKLYDNEYITYRYLGKSRIDGSHIIDVNIGSTAFNIKYILFLCGIYVVGNVYKMEYGMDITQHSREYILDSLGFDIFVDNVSVYNHNHRKYPLSTYDIVSSPSQRFYLV